MPNRVFGPFLIVKKTGEVWKKKLICEFLDGFLKDFCEIGYFIEFY